MSYLRALATPVALLALIYLAAPTLALGASDAPPPGETVLNLPLWSLGVGFLVPLATYVVNNRVLGLDEPAKAFVVLVATAVAGALTQLVDAGAVGFDSSTLKYVLASVAGALAGHHLLWKSSATNTALGAGTPPRRRRPRRRRDAAP